MSLSLDITDEVEDEWDSWGGEIWLKTNFHESTATNVLAMDHGTGQWRWIMALDNGDGSWHWTMAMDHGNGS